MIINLWGAFSITDTNGRDLTPKLAKSQALVALLASSRSGTQNRSWIQSRLWSDRSKEQANGSLRQALAILRRSLGDMADVLVSNRQRISLDLNRITLTEPEPGEEFLAGLDIRDEEFEDWLRQERATREPDLPYSDAPVQAAPQQGQTADYAPFPVSPLVAPHRVNHPVLVLTCDNTNDGPLDSVKTYLVDSVARSLRESFAITAYTNARPPTSSDAISVNISAELAQPNQIHLAARCLDSDTTELLWSGHQMVRTAGAFPFEDLNVLAWVNDIVAAITEFLGRNMASSKVQMSATHLGLAALRELFSLEQGRTDTADRLLVQAYETDPRAIFLAWRAQVRGIQIVERHSPDTQALREEGLALARQALSAEPTNSSILATTAHIRHMLDNDSISCDELSRQAVAQSPGNPLAWWSLALNYLYTDRPQLALQASERGHQLSRGSPYRFWWEMQVSFAAFSNKDYDKSILAAERSAVFGPECRPPIRYLVGLHAARGNLERAGMWTKKLQKIEPDFSPIRLISDPDYPTSLLRKSGIVTPDVLEQIRA